VNAAADSSEPSTPATIVWGQVSESRAARAISTEHPGGDGAEEEACGTPAPMRANRNQGRALSLSLLEQDPDRLAVDELGAGGGRDRQRLSQGRLGLVLQELGRVWGSHPRLRRLREVRYCEEEDTSVLVPEAQCLPDRDQTRGRAVDAAEDAVEELGLARLCVHPRSQGADPASMTSSDRKSGRMSRSNRGNACSMLISAPSRLREGVSRMELDRAFEAEAERLLDGDMQEAELL
jgi:hypothetical protein